MRRSLWYSYLLGKYFEFSHLRGRLFQRWYGWFFFHWFYSLSSRLGRRKLRWWQYLSQLFALVPLWLLLPVLLEMRLQNALHQVKLWSLWLHGLIFLQSWVLCRQMSYWSVKGGKKGRKIRILLLLKTALLYFKKQDKTYQTLPSISSSMRRLSSHAYSRGSCFTTPEMNPFTKRDIAFSSSSPLLIR